MDVNHHVYLLTYYSVLSDCFQCFTYMQRHQFGDEDCKLATHPIYIAVFLAVGLFVCLCASLFREQLLSVWFQTKTYLRSSKHKNG